MNVIAVESSTAATIAYDRTRELLQLEFNGCALYQYFGVPAMVHEALLRAPSKGSYFNQAIREKFRIVRSLIAKQKCWSRAFRQGVDGNGQSHGTHRRRSAGWQPDYRLHQSRRDREVLSDGENP
jgi:hypothetical protein